ncbi:hypothetical protein [Bifidobacterium merycicum]|uniref:hypothetical protein n=1 Tax=Bifidobacterium merycicum TaxID=78345 RepID=UPI0023F4361F|nr:hypothetical protein [Bifidobacterium merycicum]
MADKKLDVTPQEPAEEIGDDTPEQPEEPAPANDPQPEEPAPANDPQPEEPAPANDPQPEEPAPFPPAGHRSERFDAVRPDGTRVTVTRDIDTGEQRVTEA